MLINRPQDQDPARRSTIELEAARPTADLLREKRRRGWLEPSREPLEEDLRRYRRLGI